MTDDTSSTTVADTPTGLSTDVLTIMDRAVREARGKNWCVEFSTIAAPVFGVPANEVVDSDGFNCKGYNKDGFNAEGWDQHGRNKDGYNSAGFNRDGYDVEGFNRYGMNKEGLDRQGRDKYRLDYNGYDQEGYDHYGERARCSREWYAVQAAKPENDFRYDSSGNERPAARKTIKERVFGS